MTPIDDIAGTRRLAIVGVAKNCGKTTALNRLMQLRRRLGAAPPALVSAGIDGEPKDLLLGTEKPPVFVAEDQWVATSEAAIRQSTARFEYVKSLGFTTPLGEVFVCRVLEAGEVILSGLRHRRELVDAVESLAQSGPGPVWVDGAYGRVVGAHPDVAGQVVVATGAICGRDVSEVVDKTDDLVSRLGIATIDDGDERGREAMDRALEEGCVVVVDGDEGVLSLQTASAVVGLEELAQRWSPTVEAVAIPGLVSDRVVEELLALGTGRRLYVADPTAIHTEAALWHRLRKSWDVRAARTTEVVGISYNPTAVTGFSLDPGRLKQALRERFPDRPVFDPLASDLLRKIGVP